MFESEGVYTLCEACRKRLLHAEMPCLDAKLPPQLFDKTDFNPRWSGMEQEALQHAINSFRLYSEKLADFDQDQLFHNLFFMKLNEDKKENFTDVIDNEPH